MFNFSAYEDKIKSDLNLCANVDNAIKIKVADLVSLLVPTPMPST